jgi:predicted dehydrogenase
MHQMEPFTYLLGDWTSVTATTSTQWPVATLIPSGRKKENRIPDHYAFSGILASGAHASCSYRAGYPAQGRRQLLWEIDGTNGILRFEIEMSCFMVAEKGRLFLNNKEIQIDGDYNNVSSMARLWEEFAKPDGKYTTLADGVRLKALGDAILTSAREGRRIDLQ